MDAQEAIKKYWPYGLGAVAGLGLIIFINRGSSSSSSGGGDYAAMLQANTAASAQQQSYSLAKAAQDQQFAILDKQANVAALQAQGQMVGQIAGAASGLVQSLNAPTVAALNAGAAENIATIQGAVNNSVAGYAAQASLVQSTADASGKYAAAMASQTQSMADAVKASLASIGSQNVMAPAQPAQDNSQMWRTVGTLGSAAIGAFSDERVKKNVAPVRRDSVEDIERVEFVEFDYDTDKIGDQLVNHFDVGAIAQKLRAINPNWIAEVEGIEYLQLYAPAMLLSAMHAIQQLTARVKQLEGAANGEA